MTSKPTPFVTGLAMYEVSRMIRRDFDRQARSLGFNTGQWRTLWHLQRNPGITQAALADILEMQPISLMGVLDKLQTAQLIERKPHPTDGRAVQLFLTDAAGPILDKLWAIGARTRDTAMADVSPEENEILLTLLERMKNNLSIADDAMDERPLAAAGKRK